MKTWKSPRIRVQVTEELIEAATARDSNHCMIAEAVKVAYPTAKSIAVDLATIRLTDPKKHLRFTYLTPRIAQVPLVRFDRGDKPTPFDFVLRGAIVTPSGNSYERRAAHKAKTVKQRKAMRKAIITLRGNVTTVPDRVGGNTPPLQPTNDGVPFSRRRAFGLRALAL